MKNLTIVSLMVSTALLLFSCQKIKKEQKEANPKVQVQLSHLSTGYLPDFINLTGKTIYLNKSNIIAPISGYITNVSVKQGDKVKKGQLLFEMQTSEAYLMNQKEKSEQLYGNIKIYAPNTGRLVSLNIVNQGVYADKGTLMCTLLASNDLKLQVNLPFEYNKWAKTGNKCKVILPDNKSISATFSKVLPQVDELSQTIKVLANLETQQFIPENMIVKVLLDKSKKHQAQILTKQCLQTDALMSQFWVMKMLNDSVAVKVPVKIGNQNHDSVEIISPKFNDQDLFISEGAYGLGDTALVETVKE
ncbi:efflux RND transporter periplasmic adaptor subunit [Ancylomarina longa]|uniref:HlyD family efflux transporter periplasmic adaptor subunit n=1 Tax=Ancylomarina longa TaxID=2487017 RepID=A0A434AXF5_9BACT|nr:HlyD family efflux transporter periplasmic adaptor subunit [Ancylomarina longa]RUT79117.1 HlyD family efflux transporter periplasmic adaptor subunit [Ancylomarina longa]